jgi:hypothetical protein
MVEVSAAWYSERHRRRHPHIRSRSAISCRLRRLKRRRREIVLRRAQPPVTVEAITQPRLERLTKADSDSGRTRLDTLSRTSRPSLTCINSVASSRSSSTTSRPRTLHRGRRSTAGRHRHSRCTLPRPDVAYFKPLQANRKDISISHRAPRIRRRQLVGRVEFDFETLQVCRKNYQTVKPWTLDL